MPAEKVEQREISYRQWFPWTELFRGFQVALDPKKLLLAAAGLVVMAAGWWVLGTIFWNSRQRPDPSLYPGGADDPTYLVARDKWLLLKDAAEPGVGKLNTAPWL